MAILDDIINKEMRPHLVGSPEEANATKTIYRNNDSFFRVSRGVRDFKVGARIKASKATTLAELREAVYLCQKASARYSGQVFAKYGIVE